MIEVERLSKRYGRKLALDNVSFTVPAGSITGFVGPNGAGKTTALAVVAGLIKADYGRAQLDGISYRAARQPAHLLGAVMSPERLPGRSKASDLLDYACRVNGIKRQKATQMLAEVGLKDVSERRIASYSLGMRQRLGVALALLGQPRNLVFDEPANGLDPTGMAWLRDQLVARAAAGASVLVSSHILSELELIIDHVVLVAGGQILHHGPYPLESKRIVEIETPTPAAAVQVLTRAGFNALSGVKGLTVEYSGRASDLVRILIQANVEVDAFVPKRANLEQTLFAAMNRQQVQRDD
jgi:ABC-2 type transport system ATP-binding protein